MIYFTILIMEIKISVKIGKEDGYNVISNMIQNMDGV